MNDNFYEIERKFLVKTLPKNLNSYKMSDIKQGYISFEPALRVRQKNDEYFFTYKGKGDLKREEFEVKITKEQFENLWKKVERIPILKKRYYIPLGEKLMAELDIYEGELKGFYNVEVEFFSEEDANNFTPPDWFGKEITKDTNFSNANLSKLGVISNFLHLLY